VQKFIRELKETSMSESHARPSRRGFMLGAAVASAATAAVVTLPKTPEPEAAVAAAPPKPEKGGGYHVTEHVKRYYKTTLV
jgi:hypothetical protein